MKNFIQWKGTDVCIDVHCTECGTSTHFDGDFMYYYQCPKCDTIFKMGSEVSMDKVTDLASNELVQKGVLCLWEGEE